MIDTPAKLYDSINTNYSGLETNICFLHKPCKATRLCSTPSKIAVIDFDTVERQTAKSEHRSLQPSVDAITYTESNRIFCFVEIKGWQEFMKHNQITSYEHPSEDDKVLVAEKAKSYNLSKKFEYSCNLCKKIANDSQVLAKMPVAYIIVSDINVGSQAIDDIASNLTSLADSSSIWSICDTEMFNNLQIVYGIVEKYYIHCQDFDDLLNKISI